MLSVKGHAEQTREMVGNLLTSLLRDIDEQNALLEEKHQCLREWQSRCRLAEAALRREGFRVNPSGNFVKETTLAGEQERHNRLKGKYESLKTQYTDLREKLRIMTVNRDYWKMKYYKAIGEEIPELVMTGECICETCGGANDETGD